MWIFSRITHTHELTMVAKNVHGWIIFQCPMFCPSLLLTAALSRKLHVQILRNYSYIKSWPTANLKRRGEAKSQAHKLEIWRLWIKTSILSERLDRTLDAAPEGLLQANRGMKANILNDLSTFMYIVNLRVASKYLGELKCRTRVVLRHEVKFLREIEDQLRSQSKLSKLQRGECNDFWNKIKTLNPKKEFVPLTVAITSGESNIANLWKDHVSATANSVGSTDNRDPGMNALRTVPVQNNAINVYGCGRLW